MDTLVHSPFDQNLQVPLDSLHDSYRPQENLNPLVV